MNGRIRENIAEWRNSYDAPLVVRPPAAGARIPRSRLGEAGRLSWLTAGFTRLWRACTASQPVWSALALGRTGYCAGAASSRLGLVGCLGGARLATALCGRHRLQPGTWAAAGLPLFRAVALGSRWLAHLRPQPGAGRLGRSHPRLGQKHAPIGCAGLVGSPERKPTHRGAAHWRRLGALSDHESTGPLAVAAGGAGGWVVRSRWCSGTTTDSRNGWPGHWQCGSQLYPSNPCR